MFGPCKIPQNTSTRPVENRNIQTFCTPEPLYSMIGYNIVWDIRCVRVAAQKTSFPINVGCSGSSWNLIIKSSNIYIILSFFSRGLKLIEQMMKVLERVVEGLIRQRVEIDEMQCGFMSGHGTTDAIFIVCQLQEKHLAANKPLYMAFVDLEKAFDRVPRDVIWWACAN